MIFEILGWVGALMLAVCAVPQAWLSIKQGHARGVSNGLLALWLFGEAFTLAYILKLPELNWPLICNYAANIVFVSVIIWYKFNPRT